MCGIDAAPVVAATSPPSYSARFLTPDISTLNTAATNESGDVVMRLNAAPYVRFEEIGTYLIEDLIVAVEIGDDTNPQHVSAGDMNGDGKCDGRDIQVFIDALLGS